MTPTEKLKEIEANHYLTTEQVAWLIARVKDLETALVEGPKNGVFWRENAFNGTPGLYGRFIVFNKGSKPDGK